MEDNKEVLDFYEACGEAERLEHGLGKIEGFRTKELLQRFLEPSMTIYDVGGGTGYYSAWLAGLGHRVSLLELAPSAVMLAQARSEDAFSAEVADARCLPMPDNSANMVLLMGPLYHLLNWEDRLSALREALRILKPGGLLAATGISKFSSTTWALSTYGVGNNFMDDEIYFNMLRGELSKGEHHRPAEYPQFIAQAYFHTPEEFIREIEQAGFREEGCFAVEGCIWFTPELEQKWEDTAKRDRLLELLHRTEEEPSLLGMSPHFLVIARKPIESK